MAANGINQERLRARCLGNLALAGELVALFRTMAVAEAEVLRAALSACDQTAARASIHRLKSAASTVAAERLSELLNSFEPAPSAATFLEIADEIATCTSRPAEP